MPNRQLNKDELALVKPILADVRERLKQLSGNNRELLFALRRKVFKELIYDERGRPADRRKLRNQKHDEQNGLCALCGKPLPLPYSELDRFNASDGYTEQNTRLVHHECHVADQAQKSYK